jgi:riboflavin biosynthesis pyrimidine reductase
VAQLRDEIDAAPRDISVGGPTLAGQLLHAGLVSEVHHLVVPVVVGGGTRVYPDGAWHELSLLDVRRFSNGTVHQHYAVAG